MSIWDMCKICKECCNGMIISLTEKEEKKFKTKKIQKQPALICDYLVSENCNLTEKPLECEAYPLMLIDNEIRIDKDCKICEEYRKKLKNKDSEVTEHYKIIQEKFDMLTKKEKEKMNKINKLEEYDTLPLEI